MAPAPRFMHSSEEISTSAVSQAIVRPVRTARLSHLVIPLLAAPFAILTAVAVRATPEH